MERDARSPRTKIRNIYQRMCHKDLRHSEVKKKTIIYLKQFDLVNKKLQRIYLLFDLLMNKILLCAIKIQLPLYGKSTVPFCRTAVPLYLNNI